MTHLYSDVKRFNEIAGVFDGNLKEAADLYLSLDFEELCEAIDGFENEDMAELFDGAIDKIVTGFGLLQVLEKAGFNVERGMKKVAQNNLTKYTSFYPTVVNAGYSVTFNDKHSVYVLKDENGKIRKPFEFESVDLSDCLPKKDFFK